MPLTTPQVAADEQPYGPQVTFRTQDIFPPTAVYVAKDDTIVLSVRNPGAAASLDIDIRFMTPQGIVIPQQFNWQGTSTGAVPTEIVLSQSEGFLLSASIFGTPVSRGQCFIKLFIRRGGGSGDSVNGALLLQGYVSFDDWLSYPHSATESSLAGRGWLRLITITPPPAGTDVSQLVPAGRRWIVRSFLTFFGTSAVVANRFPAMLIQDATASNAIIIPPSMPIPGGSSTFLNWAPGNTVTGSAIRQSMGAPTDMILPAGWKIGTQTSGLDAGDSFTAPVAMVEEYIAQ